MLSYLLSLLSSQLNFLGKGGGCQAVLLLPPTALKVSIPNSPYLLLTIFPGAACGPAGALVCRAPVTHTCSAALGPAECQNTAGEGKSALAELEHSGTGVWCLEYAGFPARERERDPLQFSFLLLWLGKSFSRKLEVMSLELSQAFLCFASPECQEQYG